MAINCDKKNPLQRDGTSQEQRTLKTLLPGYVAVDERSIDDLRSFAIEYAREIKFYKIDETEDGDWLMFFDKIINTDSQFNSPHYALFMAFLKIFKYAQQDLNKLTERHLDFYYRDVLHLEENAAVPDQVYLIFELAKHVSLHLIEEETAFKADKDNLGNKVTYKLEDETSLNKATISELKAVFLNKDNIFANLVPYPKNDFRTYVSPQANTEDGEGGELTNEEKSWRTFGAITFPNIKSGLANATVADREQADIGFAFASPNLCLAEGERIVTIYLNFPDPSPPLSSIDNTMLYDAFRLKFSGEEKWIEPSWQTTLTATAGEVDSIVAKRVLDFLNGATSPEEIAGTEPVSGPVYDDPTKGFGDQHNDYDIGTKVAARIISVRDSLHGGRFTTLDQVRAIRYVGEDKINDLIFSFGDPIHSTKVDVANNRIIIKRTITRDQEAIVAYNKEKLLDPFDTKWPVVKVLLNTKGISNPFIYEILKDLQITSASVVCDVRELKNLVIQNDQSVLDPGKPFQPFGNRPIVSSNFYIGSWEAFQKGLNELKVNIKWFGLPDDATGFQGYYANYYTATRNNSSFTTEASLLDKKSWVEITPEKSTLFNPESGQLEADRIVSFLNTDADGEPPETLVGNIDRDYDLLAFDEYDQKSLKGFLKLTLNGTDFGHQDFQLSYTNAVLAAIVGKEEIDNYADKLPQEPYTPEIETISLDYVSTVEIDTIDVDSTDFDDRVEQFFHVHPMGVGEIKTTESENYLFPQYNNEGELYLGIKDLNPPQNLSVLFQIAEGTSDPDLIPPDIKWSYLSKNNWKDFDDDDILTDSTKGLITTGLITFSVPSDASAENTILTEKLYWFKAAAEKDSNGIPQLIDVKCQAAKVVFDDNDDDPEYLTKPLTEKTISKLVVADSAIKKIEQPFTSFGGAVKERSDDFYTRVSERLRHKNRAINIWDYERIILQNFSEVYKVKCLNHTRYEGTYSSINEAAPGNVSLIIVSNIRNKNAVDPLKPRTSLVTLHDIDDFISQIQSPYINLYVNNPLFEEVKVKFNVSFHAGFDIGIYETKLENSIIEFLSPWAFEKGSDIVFGGKIHKSVILHFVEEQEYVDYITCFEMFHIVPDDPENDPKKDIDEAVASTSASVLGSASSHDITILENEGECDCPDNEIKTIEIASADDCPCD